MRFDGQVCDMFEEEYFVPVVPAKGEAVDNAAAEPLVYKYFSELSDEEMATYRSGMDASTQ